MESVRNVIIVGSGPAGYTAAIYTARAGLEPLVFEGSQHGGALMQTTAVENFPGFPDGIQGPELMDTLRTHAGRYDAELIAEDVTGLDLAGELKTVTVDGRRWRARTVILAMGSAYRRLGLPNEERLSGYGVSWCATCDGFFFRDRHIAVVGGGDSALEEALFLTRFAETVTIVHRRDALAASQIMQDRAMANEKIRFRWNTVCEDVLGTQQVTGLAVRHTVTGEASMLPVSGVFIAIGHEPRNELVRGQLALDDAGYVLAQGRSTRTDIPGVFACGDLVDHHYRQAITAAGSGCGAALDVEAYLASTVRSGAGIGVSA